MDTSYVFLVDGFEEIEALATVDVLVRAGMPVKMVSIMSSRTVVGGHHIAVQADCLLSDLEQDTTGFLILPGGTVALDACQPLSDWLLAHYKAGRPVAAICAAPMVVGKRGMLQGRKAVCYPGFESYLLGADVQTEGVVVDGTVITAKAPGFSIDFALTIVRYAVGEKKAHEVAAAMYYTPR